MTAPLSILRPTSVTSSIESASHTNLEDGASLSLAFDSHVGGFRDHATDWETMAAILAGGVFYRVGRAGTMAMVPGRLGANLSVGTGLAAEVSAFEITNRGLQSVHPENPNLWRFSGSGGLREGFLSSGITFGSLRGAGYLARGENIIAQHLFQDTAMVFGHQTSGLLEITPRPRGSLVEQFLHAEATNLQLGAGMAMAHRFAPSVHALERGLDLITPSPLSLSLEGEGNRRSGEVPLTRHFEPALAGIAGEIRRPINETPREEILSSPQILAMTGREGGDGGRSEAGVRLLRRWMENLELSEVEDSAVAPVQDFIEVNALGLTLSEQISAIRRLLNRHFPPAARIPALADLATSLIRHRHLVEAHALLEQENLATQEIVAETPDFWSSEEGMVRVHMISALTENEIYEGEINPIYHLARIRDPNSRFMAWGVLLHALVDSGQTRRARALLESFERAKNSVATPREAAPLLRRMLREIIRHRNRLDNDGSGGVAAFLLAAGSALAASAPEIAHASFGVSDGNASSGWISMGIGALMVFGAVIRGRRNSSNPPLQLSLGSTPEDAARELWRRYADRVGDEGLPGGHRNILDQLVRYGPTGVFQVGQQARSSLAVGEVVPALRELESLGLLQSFPNGSETFWQATERGRSLERLFRPIDAWIPLPALTRPVLRRLESGRWTLESTLRTEFNETPPADLSRSLELIFERGYLERRRHRESYRGYEYRLSREGQALLQAERRRRDALRRIE